MNTSEDRKTFYAEAALSLQNEGYGVERDSDEHLLVSLDGKPLCEVTNTTGITYRQENISSPEREAAKDKAYEIVRAVGEYTGQMQSAPKLEVPGLSNQYKLLADFNGTVLAGMESRYGMQFVWCCHNTVPHSQRRIRPQHRTPRRFGSWRCGADRFGGKRD